MKSSFHDLRAPIDVFGRFLSSRNKRELLILSAWAATSGPDEATETDLLASLRRAQHEMSVVFITHRSSDLRFADRVLRLDAGSVAS